MCVKVWETLVNDFGVDEAKFKDYSTISKEDQLKGYEMMQLCRQFENACNQAYMQGKIRGFMHLDNGQVCSVRTLMDLCAGMDMHGLHMDMHGLHVCT